MIIGESFKLQKPKPNTSSQLNTDRVHMKRVNSNHLLEKEDNIQLEKSEIDGIKIKH